MLCRTRMLSSGIRLARNFSRGRCSEEIESRRMTPSYAQEPNRRSFLCSLASVLLNAKTKTQRPEKGSETAYRFRTPECEVHMSVQFFVSSQIKGFHFHELLSDRAFCLSASGEEGRGCLDRFSGSVAIARYHFRSHKYSQIPSSLREHVLTIDHDNRMSPRPPFERVLLIREKVVSDIQAFGYKTDELEQPPVDGRPLTLWCLLRQDLYLSDQTTPFLTIHWKHALDSISLLDLVLGERTELLSD